MPEPRDSRADPQAGDVLRRGNEQRKVTGVQLAAVYFERTDGRPRRMWLTNWLRWAKDAEVLEVRESSGRKELMAEQPEHTVVEVSRALVAQAITQELAWWLANLDRRVFDLQQEVKALKAREGAGF